MSTAIGAGRRGAVVGKNVGNLVGEAVVGESVGIAVGEAVV